MCLNGRRCQEKIYQSNGYKIEHIEYNKLEDVYNTDILTDAELTDIKTKKYIETEKNLFNYLVYDSDVEKKFAEELDSNNNVSVYVKLPTLTILFNSS